MELLDVLECLTDGEGWVIPVSRDTKLTEHELHGKLVDEIWCDQHDACATDTRLDLSDHLLRDQLQSFLSFLLDDFAAERGRDQEAVLIWWALILLNPEVTSKFTTDELAKLEVAALELIGWDCEHLIISLQRVDLFSDSLDVWLQFDWESEYLVFASLATLVAAEAFLRPIACVVTD